MANLIKIADFESGRFKIPTNEWTGIDLDQYMDKYERHYLIRLLGVELYNLFVADLDGNGEPQDPIYQDIYNSFVYEDNCNKCESEGMKEMLKAFVYFHFVRDIFTRVTTVGVSRSKGENSENLDKVAADLTTRYNQGVMSFDCIQKYICNNSATYPTYNGWHDVEKILFI